MFNDVVENYAFSVNADGTYRVEQLTVSDGNDAVTGRPLISDGVDTLRNIELLQFSNGTFSVDQLFNVPATGVPVISDLTPTEGQALSVDTSAIADANGIASALSYQWQASSDGLTWDNVPALIGGNDATFSPLDVDLGFLGNGIDSLAGAQLRVVVSFTDGAGNAESLTSEPTAPVGANWSRGLLTGGHVQWNGWR